MYGQTTLNLVRYAQPLVVVLFDYGTVVSFRVRGWDSVDRIEMPLLQTDVITRHISYRSVSIFSTNCKGKALTNFQLTDC